MVNSTAIHLRDNDNAEISNGKNSSFNDYAHKIHLKNLAYAEECGDREIKTNIHRNLGYQGSIEWSASEQARLFAALFYGGFITIWFSGYLADRFGPKFLIGMAVLDMSVCSLLSPVLVDLNYYAFFVARFLMGLGDGFIFPTVASANARWSPPAERSLMFAICTLGNQIAAVVALLVGSRLCAIQFLDGWRLIFLSFGAIGMTSFTLWTIFAANSPDESSWIGLKEKQMITASLTAGGSRKSISSRRLNTGKVPWSKMARSLPLYAGIIGQVNCQFCTMVLQSYLPTYLKEYLKLSLNDNGIYSMLPFLSMIFSKIFFSIVADQLRKRNKLTDTQSVKLFQAIANIGAATSAFCMAKFVTCSNPQLAIVFLITWGMCFGTNASGFFTQLLLIAPRYSGLISSISTGFTYAVNGISPSIISAIIKHGAPSEWRTIWYILFGSNLFCAAFFILFASGKQQKWADAAELSRSETRTEDCQTD
uniref:Major facilitator superfamily (MFS) profile domain-containing protein n=1 Tax=Meloidogyne incognita TaxID=6306 RepID=A0A914LHN8_MELIC